MVLFAVLAIAAGRTLTDGTVRAVTLAVIASFAARTYLQHRRNEAGVEETARAALTGSSEETGENGRE